MSVPRVRSDHQSDKFRILPPSMTIDERTRHNSMTYPMAEYDVYQTLDDGEDLRISVMKGEWNELPERARRFIGKYVKLLNPLAVYLCDGSEDEATEVADKLVERGLLFPLTNPKFENCYLCRTDPADVARVEGKTFLVTDDKYDSVPHTAEDVVGELGRWMSTETATKEMLRDRMPNSMKGRVMYVIPFSMGPIGGPMSKFGIQLTDYNYVVLSMRIMTRVDPCIWKSISKDSDFVQCIHTIGVPRPLPKKPISHWPCNPERVLVLHEPKHKRVLSYGSGYGGNSLLGKKCFALRIASSLARDEGWLAEHMLIMSITNPAGKEFFICAAFPSACGKTNLAMLCPTLPGWKARCVGDDIAWLKFNEKTGKLHAINPEAGFFGVAPGTSSTTNPHALDACMKNTIFTNVGLTDDGGIFWEGLEDEIPAGTKVTNWMGEHCQVGDGSRIAHPNSRFCTPAENCKIIHDKWQDPEGVPIDAIIFGGRRPRGVPLVFEARDWDHGVFVGASLKSEATAAAEHTGKKIMHDPMAMRPFFGYNFGQYLRHWLDLNQKNPMPKIFHVNWFRKDINTGKFLWPGFGDNIRVLDWICRRLEGEDIAQSSPIGLIPKPGSIDTSGLGDLDMEQLMSIPKEYWKEDMEETRTYLENQVGIDLPREIRKQLDQQEDRIENI